ncbi:MAG: DUF502 domain-containing protein [Phycisphaerae bacterium]
MAESFGSDFRRFFLRGLAAVLPTVLSIVIILWLFRKIHEYVGQYINVAVIWLASKIIWQAKGPGAQWDNVAELYNHIKNEYYEPWLIWVGFVLAIVGIYIFGRFVASFLGRGIWRMIERTLIRLPIVKLVYPYVKQVTDFLLSEQKIEFNRVVAVEYPRKGIWSIGLVTAPGMRTIQAAVGGELLTVFIPSSPTPMTGYTITVKREEVIDLPMNIEDALRFTISGGVIMPLNEQRGQAEIEQARQSLFPLEKKKRRKETPQ